MAGDWIPMRCDLTDDPAVIGIAADLELTEDHVVGLLHNVWSWASCQTVDGNAPSVTFAFLNRRIGVTGFAESMEKHGWLQHKGVGLTIPKFDRYNSESAKTRAKTRIRVRKHRNGPSVTKSVPEKRREEKKKESPKKDSLAVPAKRERNPWWDAVVAIWYPDGVPDSQRAQVGRLAADFKTLGATEDGMRTRRTRLRETWGSGADTPFALVKHWAQFSEPCEPQTRPGQRHSPAQTRAEKPAAAARGEYPEPVRDLPDLI